MPRLPSSPRPAVRRGDRTRTQILKVAQKHFAKFGYAEASTEDIVAEAGVTRGALYYHFRDKQDLFRAVVNVLYRGLVEDCTTAMARTRGLEGIIIAANCYWDACIRPDIGRVLLTDGPAVLGLKEWLQIDSAHGMEIGRKVVREAIELGQIPAQPIEPLATMLVGAAIHGALVMTQADDLVATRAAISAVYADLVNGLRRPASSER